MPLMIANVLLVVSLLAFASAFAVHLLELKRKWGTGLSWQDWWYSDRSETLAFIAAALIACYAGAAALGW